MKTTRRWIALAMAAGTAVACTETEPEDELTLGQSITFLREMWELAEWGWELAQWGAEDPVPCPLGGIAAVDFADDYRDRGDTTWYSELALVTPAGCEVSAFGDTLVLNGDPSIAFDSEGWFESFDNNEVDMRITGAVTWTKNHGTSNTCEVDLTMDDAKLDPGSVYIDGDLAGLLCGRDAFFHLSEIR